MAITLQPLKISTDLRGVVSGAIEAVRAVRATERAKKESEFQKAIAEGMSYDAQVTFRQKQLEEEKTSAFSDPEYIKSLTEAVTSLKKYARFANYREKYQDSLTKLASGKITAVQQLQMLQEQLQFTSDPDLKQEIQNGIVETTQAVKTYEDTILANEVKRAQNDKTVPLLTKAISDVQNKRSLARLNGNEDEASAYDVTLSVLQAQLGQVQIEDTLRSAQVTSLTKGLNAPQKIDLLASKIADADATTPITVEGKRYASARDYWTQTRDAYVSGNGSGLFADAMAEIDSYYKNYLTTTILRDGYATTLTLDTIKNNFDALKNRPEMQPYLDRVAAVESNLLYTAAATTTKKIVENTAFNEDYQSANQQLLNLTSRYGIDTESYRMQLATNLAQRVQERNQITGEATPPEEVLNRAGLSVETFPTPPVSPATKEPAKPAPAATAAPTVTPAVPTVPIIPVNEIDTSAYTPEQKQAFDAAKAAATPAPETPPAPPTPAPTPMPSSQTYTVRKGDTLSAISQRLLGNAARYQEIADLNSIADPDRIKAGAVIKIPQ